VNTLLILGKSLVNQWINLPVLHHLCHSHVHECLGVVVLFVAVLPFLEDGDVARVACSIVAVRAVFARTSATALLATLILYYEVVLLIIQLYEVTVYYFDVVVWWELHLRHEIPPYLVYILVVLREVSRVLHL
jgi:hypothetical protein